MSKAKKRNKDKAVEANLNAILIKERKKKDRELAAQRAEQLEAKVQTILSSKKVKKETKKEKIAKYVDDLVASHPIATGLSNYCAKIRDLESWDTRGKKGTDALTWSLIQHYYCKYPMANFWYYLWKDPHTFSIHSMMVEAFFRIGKGESLYKLAQDRTVFNIPLTKKMCHEFLNSVGKESPMHAIIDVKVRAFGGEPWLASAINNFTLFSMGGWVSFNDEYIAWMCKVLTPRPCMFNIAQVRDLKDFISEYRNESRRKNIAEGTPLYSLKGRTLSSVTSAMIEWHEHLAKVKATTGAFDSCKIPGFSYEQNKETIWTITEILTGKQLADEGKAMSHCVYSYKYQIDRGACAIYSLKCSDTLGVNKERVATIQVDPKQKLVKQVRGRMNKSVSLSHRSVINRWMQEVGLQGTGWAW